MTKEKYLAALITGKKLIIKYKNTDIKFSISKEHDNCYIVEYKYKEKNLCDWYGNPYVYGYRSKYCLNIAAAIIRDVLNMKGWEIKTVFDDVSVSDIEIARSVYENNKELAQIPPVKKETYENLYNKDFIKILYLLESDMMIREDNDDNEYTCCKKMHIKKESEYLLYNQDEIDENNNDSVGICFGYWRMHPEIIGTNPPILIERWSAYDWAHYYFSKQRPISVKLKSDKYVSIDSLNIAWNILTKENVVHIKTILKTLIEIDSGIFDILKGYDKIPNDYTDPNEKKDITISPENTTTDLNPFADFM